jgi:hypothetical protein
MKALFGFVLAAAIGIFIGCVSSGTYREEIHRSEDRQKVELLQSWQRQVKEVERRAYAEGKLAVWENLSISGVPSSEGIIFKDYFLTVAVKIKGRSVYSFRFKTEGSESGFSTALSNGANAAQVGSILASF